MALKRASGYGDDCEAYSTETDEFLRITFCKYGAPNKSWENRYFRVETKDGTTYRFGYANNSTGKSMRWEYGNKSDAWIYSLDHVEDRNGNTIDLYNSEWITGPRPDLGMDNYDRTHFPNVISYGANPSHGIAQHDHHVQIRSLGPRDDYLEEPGWPAQYLHKSKIDFVDMYLGGQVVPDASGYHIEGGQLVRSYELGHAYGKPMWHVRPAGGGGQAEGLNKLLLTSVTERDASGNALPPTTFSYYTGTDSIPSANFSPGSTLGKYQLKEVTNGYGAKTTYSYEGYMPVDAWSDSLMHRYRVTRVETQPGTETVESVSPTVRQDYTYGTAYQVPNTTDFRGHASVKVTDARGPLE